MGDSLLLVNGHIAPSPGDDTVPAIPSGFILIEKNRIAAMGSMDEIPRGIENVRQIDAHGGIIMPGLVNCHCHAPMTLFRGMADDLALMEWLNEHIFPAEGRWVSPEMVYDCALLAACEMIAAGTTCVADGYFFEYHVAAAFRDAGLRGIAAQGIIDFPAPGVPDPAHALDYAARFIAREQTLDPLVQPAVFCHSPYTCAPDTMVAAKKLADSTGTLFFVHLAETKAEAGIIKERHGDTSPARLLHRLGILDKNTVLIHGVWLDDHDCDLIAKCGAAIVTCTSSNMKLASGVAPVAAMLAKDIPVALGTDGAASGNRLDLFAEMDLTAKLHKVRHQDPTVLPAKEVLKMATSAGAGVLQLEDTGLLAQGMLADIIIVALNTERLTPFHSPDTLVYAGDADDVDTVIINGHVVMEQKRFVDPLLNEAKKRVRRLQDNLQENKTADKQ